MPKLKAILFDKDGTLLDFHATWSAWSGKTIAALADGDRALQDQLDGALGYDRAAGVIADHSVIIAGSAGDIAASAAPILRCDLAELEQRLITASLEVPPILIPGTRDMLEHLKGQGMRLGIATNDAEAAAQSQLRQLDLHGLFDFIAGYDSGHGAKPGPGMCLAFAQAMRLAPEEVAMVGDSTHDLQAARAAGMVSVGVLTGPADAAELAPLADHLLSSVRGLPGLT